MAYFLSEDKLRGFEKYKYNSVDTSVLSNYVMHPFWNWCVQFCPVWVAPNLLTFTGFLLTVLNFLLFSYYDFGFYASTEENVTKDHIPSWVWAVSAVNLFVAYTLDGIDGKQARRTGTSGPLGELFDHGLDSYSAVLIPTCLYSIFGSKPAGQAVAGRWASCSTTDWTRTRRCSFPPARTASSEARRTGTSELLGKLFDHGLDSILGGAHSHLLVQHLRKHRSTVSKPAGLAVAGRWASCSTTGWTRTRRCSFPPACTQARRTGTSELLGELFDHGLNSYSSVLIPTCLYSIFGRQALASCWASCSTTGWTRTRRCSFPPACTASSEEASIDGKQACRTGSSGPLGELFDHGLDSYSAVLIPTCLYSIFGRDELSPLRYFFVGSCALLLVTSVIGPAAWRVTLPGGASPGLVFELTLYFSAMLTSQTVILWNMYKSLGDVRDRPRGVARDAARRRLARTHVRAHTLLLGHAHQPDCHPVEHVQVSLTSLGHVRDRPRGVARDATRRRLSRTRVRAHTLLLGHAHQPDCHPVEHVQMRPFTEAVRPLVPLLMFFLLSSTWALFSPNDIINRAPRLFYVLTGTIFSNINVSNIIMHHQI
ncbi:Phosphatidyltransferase [Operophtera brumata]|uniref:Phosphatidyltransferase n=1 Tax=Operophtera brumata TaxID=104452 RepID=A0A0L7L934_OPEBR|nr:Phosphatidyltransferase [Operophtera brumata]